MRTRSTFVRGLHQDGERAVNFAARFAGQPLADFLLHEEKEARRRTRQPQAFHKQRRGDVIGQVAADDCGREAELWQQVEGVAFAQIEFSLRDFHAEALAQENAEAAIFLECDHAQVLGEQPFGQRAEAGADLHHG